MIRRTQLCCIVIAAFCTFSCCLDSADAQGIQLPTVRVFNISTVVSVPDGGTISLGGVNRSSRGSISRGLPGGRPFQNRAIGRASSAANSSVSAKLIIMSEYEKEVMAEAERRRKLAALTDRNGPPAVQQKADFMSRHIGRSRSRKR